MPIPVTCPACGFQTAFDDATAGKKGRCPQCGAVIQVPAESPPIVDAEVVEAAGFGSAVEPVSGSIPVVPGAGAGAESSAVERRPCPACGELIAASALKCRFCNEIFDPEMKKQAAKDARKGGALNDDMSTGDWVAAILCSGIGCIAGIIWMLQGKPKGKKMFLVSFCMGVLWGIIRAVLESAGVFR